MNILFICHGNRFRSPFAECITKSLRPDWRVESAGVKDPIGTHPAAPPARAAAEERGLSLATHRARLVSWDMMEKADWVLFMDRGNLRRLHERFGTKFDTKLLCLASVVGGTRIPDPCFISGEGRLAIWEIIVRACTAFVESRQ